MSAATGSATAPGTVRADPSRAADLSRHTAVLAAGLVRRVLRSPGLTLSNLIIAAFFLVTYNGLLGGSSAVEALTGGDFLAFVLPVAVLSAAVSGTQAGQLLIEDVESGYVRRLLAMPVARAAVVLAPMLVGALTVLVQTAVVVAVGVAMGVRPDAGPAGLLVVVLLGFAFGMAFAGYAVAVALVARNAASVQSASFIFFPLLFLAPTFLPADQLQGWLQTVSAANPVTYVFQAMRVPLVGGDARDLVVGSAVAVGLAVAALAAATAVAGRAGGRR